MKITSRQPKFLKISWQENQIVKMRYREPHSIQIEELELMQTGSLSKTFGQKLLDKN